MFLLQLSDWGESEKYPKLVCHECYSTINKFHEFYEIVLESKAKITEIVEFEKSIPVVEIESSPEPEDRKSPKIEACDIYDGEIDEDIMQLPSARKAIFMNRNPNKLLLEVYDMSCKKCDDLKFARFEDLDEHYEKIHKEKGYIKCCQKLFRSKSHAIDHAEWHQNPVIFDCAFNCPGAEFKDRKSLREHENVCKYLENARYFKCQICLDGFFSKSDVLNHETEIHAYTRPPTPVFPTPPLDYPGRSTFDNQYPVINRVGKRTRFNCRICHKINHSVHELKVRIIIG